MKAKSRPPYIGSMAVALGDTVWDQDEGVFARCVLEEDTYFSCGVDCCGVAEHAVVEVARCPVCGSPDDTQGCEAHQPVD